MEHYPWSVLIFVNVLGTLLALVINRRRKQHRRDTLPPDPQHNVASKPQALSKDIGFGVLMLFVMLVGSCLFFLIVGWLFDLIEAMWRMPRR